jgi:hypothetical protein
VYSRQVGLKFRKLLWAACKLIYVIIIQAYEGKKDDVLFSGVEFPVFPGVHVSLRKLIRAREASATTFALARDLAYDGYEYSRQALLLVFESRHIRCYKLCVLLLCLRTVEARSNGLERLLAYRRCWMWENRGSQSLHRSQRRCEQQRYGKALGLVQFVCICLFLTSYIMLS